MQTEQLLTGRRRGPGMTSPPRNTELRNLRRPWAVSGGQRVGGLKPRDKVASTGENLELDALLTHVRKERGQTFRRDRSALAHLRHVRLLEDCTTSTFESSFGKKNPRRHIQSRLRVILAFVSNAPKPHLKANRLESLGINSLPCKLTGTLSSCPFGHPLRPCFCSFSLLDILPRWASKLSFRILACYHGRHEPRTRKQSSSHLPLQSLTGTLTGGVSHTKTGSSRQPNMKVL